MKLRIEEARPSDATALVVLRRKVLEEGQWFVTEADEEAGPEAWVPILAEGEVHVARLGPALVGMVKVQAGSLRRTRHVGHLEILVEAGHRGQGLGRALLKAALEAAKEREIQKVALSVYSDNARAIALYQSLGFVQEGYRRGEYLWPDGSLRDDLLMARWL